MSKLKIIVVLMMVFAFGVMSETITIVDKIGGFRNAQACAIDEGIVYILDYYYVISYDPVSDNILDTLNLGEYVRNLDFIGDMAVVVGISEVHVVDISDPNDLSELSSVNYGGTSGWDIEVEGDLVFLAVQSHLAIYRLAGYSLTYTGGYVPSTPFPMVRSVAVSGDVVYVGLGDMGLAALDVSTPTMPVLLMSADTPGNTLDLEIARHDKIVCCDGAYVGADTASVRFFGIPSPTTIDPLGAWFAPSNSDARRCFIVGDRLALADGEGGLRAIDFSIPSSPVQLVQVDTRSNITDVVIDGDAIYATGTDTFFIMVTDAFPRDTGDFEPIVINSVMPPTGSLTACDPIIEFGYTAGSNALDESSISISALGTTFGSSDPEVSWTSSTITIDLSSRIHVPTDTIRASLVYLEDVAGSIAVGLGITTRFRLDNFAPSAALTEGYAGDWEHPDSVIICGTIDDIGYAGFATDSFKVIVNGISYSTASAYLSYSAPNFTCNPMGVFHDGDTVDVCIRAADLMSLSVCGPNILDSCWFFRLSSTGIEDVAKRPKEMIISVSPNPFNSAVLISVDANIEKGFAPISAEVFDLSGRRIDVIARRATPDAAISPFIDTDCHAFQARNDGGGEFVWQPAPAIGSGIYLVRARFDGGQTAAKRVVYLK
ncbi:hypothetical protein KAH81_08930 [bacterium]|nr:hypothetical protein [bacterium]